MFDIEQTTAISYCGAGRVRSIGGQQVHVQLAAEPRETVTARMALAYPYQPAVGDTLLVLGGGADYYVVGVLAGTGRTSLELPGDVDVVAVDGTLRLAGDRGVEITGPDVTLRAGKLAVMADAVTEKVGTAYRWVKDLLTLRAGQSRRVIEGEDYTQSKRSVTLSEGTIKIDGDQIHLGH